MIAFDLVAELRNELTATVAAICTELSPRVRKCCLLLSKLHPPHDVGGQFDVSIEHEEKEEEQWELNTYVTCEVLAWRGAWTAEERRRRADNDLGYTMYLGMPYYGRWIWSAAKMLVDKKHITITELMDKFLEVKSRYETK